MSPDPKLLNEVYFGDGSCSCRACGLEWDAHGLQVCPRCEANDLRPKLETAMVNGRVLLGMVIKARGMFGGIAQAEEIDKMTEFFDPTRKPKTKVVGLKVVNDED